MVQNYCFVNTDIGNWVIGGIFNGITYGGVVTLTIFCLQLLWRNEGLSERSPKNLALISYVALMFFLATLILASNTYNIFHGVNSIAKYNIVNTLGRMGDVCYVLSNWGADALLIWRCMVIYKGCRFPRLVVTSVPTILFLASIGTGIAFLCFPPGTGDILLVGKTGDPETVQSIHASVTLALNVAVTFMIISRLLLYRRRIVRVLGKEHGTPYTGIIAMIIESQVVVVVAGLLLVIEGSATVLVYQLAAQVQILAPLLIIFRVAQGKAWSSGTYGQVTTVTAGGRNNTSYLSTMQFESIIEKRMEPSQTELPVRVDAV
ncbi:hypothetical protein BDQ17DRAFT_1360107, partial [Cyathus striatus]